MRHCIESLFTEYFILSSRHEESHPPLPPLVTNGGVLKPREWNSIGATYEYRLGVLRLWHNGMIVQEQHFHRRIEITSHLPVYIGTTSYNVLVPNAYLLGKVSDLQFYPEAIRQEQIMTMAGIPTEGRKLLCVHRIHHSRRTPCDYSR